MRRILPALLAVLLLPWGSTAHAEGVHRGTLEIHHRDDFRRGVSRTTYHLAQGRRHRRLLLRAAPRISAGSRVTVRGRRVGSAIHGSIQRRRARAAAADSRLGARKTAVLLFNFSSDDRRPWTPDHVRQRIFTDADSTNAFYREQSYDQVQLVGKERADGDVLGWYTIDAPTSDCDVDLWAGKARAAAAADGRDLSGYDHVIYAFPGLWSCSFTGVAEMPGREVWLNGGLEVWLLAHELGHNMGLHHASSMTCTSGGAPAPVSGDCATQEYGDPYDVMGNADHHANGWHLDKLGYLKPANVQTVTAGGTYTVRSAISQSGEPQVLRIPRTRDASGAVSDYYHLEFRTSGGVFDDFPSWLGVVNGVSIRVAPEPSEVVQSKLIDTTPGSSYGFWDSALAVDRIFSDGAVSVTTRAISGEIATVAVRFAAEPPTVDPTAPDASRPSVPRGLRGAWISGRVSLAWEPSVDDRGVARYLIFRDGVQIGSAEGPSYEDSTALTGSVHAYAVAAVDAAGNRSDLSASYLPDPSLASGVRPDLTAPIVRVTRPGRRRRVAGKLPIAAVASDDAAVTRMELWIDGSRRARTVGPRLAFTWRPGRRARGRYTIEVRAFDANGNMGRRTVGVTAVGPARR